MKEIFNAIYNFLSELGIQIYPENGVPADAVFPYLSWTPTQVPWDADGVMPCRIWDRAFTYERLAGLSDKLAGMIGEGITLETPNGYIDLWKGDPFSQPQPMQGSEVKVLLINIGISTMIP